MRASHDRDGDDAGDDDELLDEEFPLGDGTADGAATVYCPHCSEPNEVSLDPGSGVEQEYVEDCQVCCRPWWVVVTYDRNGRAHVEARPDNE